MVEDFPQFYFYLNKKQIIIIKHIEGNYQVVSHVKCSKKCNGKKCQVTNHNDQQLDNIINKKLRTI